MWHPLRRELSKERTLYAILGLLVLALWLPRFQGPIDLRWDGGVYYVLGTSLAEGKGYRLLNEPGEIQAVQYPPLFPLVIAAHQWVLGTNDPLIVGRWLRLFAFATFSAYAVMVFVVLKFHLPPKIAFIGTVICLFQMTTYFLSDLLFPEVLYGLVTAAFVVCVQRGQRQSTTILAAVLAIAAFGLRSIGVALLMAWIAEGILARQFKLAIVRFAIAIIPLLGWQAYIASVTSGSEYGRPAYDYQRAPYMFYNVSYAKNIFTLNDPFRPEEGQASAEDVAARLFSNLVQIPKNFGENVSTPRIFYELPWKRLPMPFPVSTPWPVDLALISLGVLVLGGIGLHVARREWLLPIYAMLYVGAVCLTPWPGQFGRYLMPLTPFFGLFLLTTLVTVSQSSGRWKASAVTFTVSVIFLIVVLQGVTFWGVHVWGRKVVEYQAPDGRPVQYRLFFYRDSHRALDSALDWVQRHASSSDVLAGSMPHWMYLRTNLKSVMPPFEVTPAKAQALLDSVPVTYLFLDEGLAVDTKRYMNAVIQKFPDLWERVYVDTITPEHPGEPSGQFEIYRRIGLPARSPVGLGNHSSDSLANP